MRLWTIDMNILYLWMCAYENKKERILTSNQRWSTQASGVWIWTSSRFNLSFIPCCCDAIFYHRYTSCLSIKNFNFPFSADGFEVFLFCPWKWSTSPSSSYRMLWVEVRWTWCFTCMILLVVEMWWKLQ